MQLLKPLEENYYVGIPSGSIEFDILYDLLNKVYKSLEGKSATKDKLEEFLAYLEEESNPSSFSPFNFP